MHRLNLDGVSLKCKPLITFELHIRKIKVNLSWAEALYAEQYSFRVCSWLKFLGPQAPKRLSHLKGKTLVSKLFYFISTSLFSPLWQFHWEAWQTSKEVSSLALTCLSAVDRTVLVALAEIRWKKILYFSEVEAWGRFLPRNPDSAAQQIILLHKDI